MSHSQCLMDVGSYLVRKAALHHKDTTVNSETVGALLDWSDLAVIRTIHAWCFIPRTLQLVREGPTRPPCAAELHMSGR